MWLLGLSLLFMGCVAPEHSFSDGRFDARIQVEDGKLVITFTKVPFPASISDITIEKKVGGDVGYEYYSDCEADARVEKGKPVSLDCLPSEPGTYLLRFKITHFHGSGYRPVEGETCLQYGDGHWECESRGRLEFKVS